MADSKAATKAPAKKVAKKASKKSGSSAALLKDYKAKRDFSKTSEPVPEPAKSRAAKLVFVVQKHDARRLHFDLRLELDGVLKSWAVTRGPSMTPGVRRLAVETEDHPMAYKDWEGVIPQGEYGGGTMIVWDQGTWAPEGDPHEGLKQGRLTFRLEGKRLKGSWSLVRMKDEGKRHNWLLIKRSDEFALAKDAEEPVAAEMKSVISGKSNDELKQKGTLRADHKARAAKVSTVTPAELKKLPGVKKGILPPFVEPSLCVSVPRPPQSDGWIHEIKHDGYRIQARLDGGKVKLLTRKGLDWTKRFPNVAEAVKGLAAKAALIDGEIIVQDEQGHSSFSGLQTDLKAGRQDRIVYYVFDLLYLDGQDMRGAPLSERKRVLQELVSSSPTAFALRFNDHLEEVGADILGEACRLGLEGIVSKRVDMPYVSGRGEQWVKSKCMLRQEFVVVGFLPASDIKDAVGSLVLGYYANGVLMHAGRAGTGYSTETAKSLYKQLLALKSTQPEFGNKLSRPAARDVIWVKPQAVAEIEYRGRTADGLVRQAAYVGLREDKPAAEVTLEQDPGLIPQHADPKAAAAPAKQSAVTFTHPERVLWEDAGVTKQELADYYSAVEQWILPHVSGRVLSLVRCPDGAAKQCFFAKHAWMGLDPAISLVDIGDEKPMMAIRDLAGLHALVQMNVLEIHVWGSRVSDIERPDRLIFDFDPGPGVTWEGVKDAAVEMRDRLQKLGLRSFLKTSGGKGLHVTVPIMPELDWDTAKDVTKLIAQSMAADDPSRYVATMTKSRRQGRIFIDYLRNGRGATAVAPYSTRARAGAPVAMPIDWSELKSLPSASHYTVRNAMARLSKLKDDPWAELPRIRQKLKV